MQGRDMDHRGRRIMRLATVIAVLPVVAWAHTVSLEGEEALARGLNVSILFLLCMPVAIVGVILATLYLTQKRAQRQGRAAPQPARAHRTRARQVLHVLAGLFFD